MSYNCSKGHIPIYDSVQNVDRCEMCGTLLHDYNNHATHFWLSFRDEKLNKNLGVAMVEGGTMMHAVVNSHKHKINPGGEVAGIKLKPENVKALTEQGIEPMRLYTEQDLDQIQFRYKKGLPD
jgi:hypothetical protein